MSLAATSISWSIPNSTLMRERPSELLEFINLMPSTPAMRSSIICVIRVSTMDADAPE